jgi:hypothetical protein
MTQMDTDRNGNLQKVGDHASSVDAVAEGDDNHERPQLSPRSPQFHLRPSASSADKKRVAPVSLTMIVKNEEENIRNCVGSVAGLFDKLVMVDTGSTDRTRELARDFGANVFEFEWVDNFAAARNEALARATGDYAFWLDADDVADPPDREKLQTLFYGLGRGDCNGGLG